MKYPKTITDEATGLEVPSELYKACQDGIMEVAEWIRGNSWGDHYRTRDTTVMDRDQWQAKLKSWGIGASPNQKRMGDKE